MKKNPLFYKRTNSNSLKIAFAKRKLFLSLALYFVFALITTASIATHQTSPKDVLKTTVISVASFALIPFVAGVKGEGESDEDFVARKGAAETPEAFVKRYMAYLEKEIKAAKEDPEIKKELKTLKDAIAALKPDTELLNNLKEEVKKTNEAIEGMKEQSKKVNTDGIKAQVTAWVKKNKALLDNIKSGTKCDLPAMELKLNSPMLPSNTYNGSAYLPIPEFAPGATEIVRVQPTFWDYIKKGRTGSAVYVWVNKKNPEGAAAFIGPGVAKPGISFEIATEISNAKKVAASEKVATELLEDIDGMVSWVEMELRYQLMAKVNTTLMTGVSSATVPAGIQTISVPYSLTTVLTTNPNTWDAIRAAVAQLRSGNLQGPVTAFLNPIDYANMVLTKAISQGQYMNNPPETGAVIVEDNNIPVGFVQIALLDYYKILIYKDFQITFGWENDDFTKNLVTAVAEMRIHQFFSENHTGAFIYDELADIQAAITAP